MGFQSFATNSIRIEFTLSPQTSLFSFVEFEVEDAQGMDEGGAEVGEDIRWTVIAEEMARIDAESKATDFAAEE